MSLQTPRIDQALSHFYQRHSTSQSQLAHRLEVIEQRLSQVTRDKDTTTQEIHIQEHGGQQQQQTQIPYHDDPIVILQQQLDQVNIQLKEERSGRQQDALLIQQIQQQIQQEVQQLTNQLEHQLQASLTYSSIIAEKDREIRELLLSREQPKTKEIEWEQQIQRQQEEIRQLNDNLCKTHYPLHIYCHMYVSMLFP
jgi:hypothetical protein